MAGLSGIAARTAIAIAAMCPALVSGAAARSPCPPLEGSAPAIMADLAGRISGQVPGIAPITPPFGPPQGELDPKLRQFLAGKRAFAFLTRELAEADLAAFRLAHGGRAPVVVPIAGGSWDRFGYVDAVVVIVNRANPLRSLTLRQLDGILSVTHWRGGPDLTRWDQLGLGGALHGQPIAIKGGEAWLANESARALTIRRTVLSRGPLVGRWRKVPGSGSEAEVVEGVGQDPAAIGFTGAGHLSQEVRPVAIEGIAATAASAADGSYPLLRTADLLFDAPRGRIDRRLMRFARWLLSGVGQATIAGQGDLSALPPPAMRRARRALAALVPIRSCR